MNRAHARAELDRFLGIAPDDDVFVDPAPPRRDIVWTGPVCPPRPAFFDQAACRDVPTEVFFAFGQPGRREQPTDEQLLALATCAQCPVHDECRHYGREHRLHGIWGGETEHDRAKAGRAPVLASTEEIKRHQRAADKRRRAGTP